MKARITLAAMAFGVLTCAVALYAQAPAGKAPSSEEITKLKDDLRLREQILARQFQEFQDSLLRLKQRLERSAKLEDRERAAQLQRVLEESSKLGVGVQFEQMVDFLKTNKFAALGDIKIALEKSNKLADDLRFLLDAMRQDSKHAKLRDERMRLEQLIKEIEKVIHDQRVVQAQTDLGKTDPKELKGNQGKVTDATAKIAKAMTDKANGADAKNTKGDAKDAGKGQGKKADSKDAGEQGDKSGQAKEGGDSKENKADAKGDQVAKDDKGNPSEAKGGKGGDPKDAGAKGSKSGDGQAEAKDNKSPKKDEVASKDGGDKSSLKEKAEAKGAKPEQTAKADAKSSPSKDGGAAKGSKGGEPKAGDPKAGGKPSESQGKAKPGEDSQGQSQAKAGDPKADNKDDKKTPPAGPQDPKDNLANGKKRVEEAGYKMQQAEEKIAKKDNPNASDDQGRAITDMEKAKKKLEELLRQIREEELERLLAALQARCEKMLAMQISVYNGTQGVFKAIDAGEDKKANRQQQQDSLKLSDNEKDIVLEASKAMEMLEAEGSAVAFPEVFQQVREDMKHVQRRLEVTDVGVVTQAIETDIIDTLKEMIEALKKARQELDAKKGGPPKEGSPPPNADQKLLEQIAELKMIRSMQLRVNTRTQTYAKMYVPKEGEQTSDPNIRLELHNLSERQERIYDVTNRIAKGDNK